MVRHRIWIALLLLGSVGAAGALRSADPPDAGAATVYDKISPVNGQFGQFRYRDFAGKDDIEIDPEWVKANIVSVTLPKVGKVRCHKNAKPYLVAAFKAIQDKKLEGQILKFNGLWVPRYQRLASHEPRHLSNHSWGSAIDLNFINTKARCANVPPYMTCAMDGSKGTGEPSPENRTLWQEAFQPNSFRWGANFSARRRDPMHFEVNPTLPEPTGPAGPVGK